MNSDYSPGEENMVKGICSNCDDSVICRFHMEGETPVFFCEEYCCEANPQGKIPEHFHIPHRHVSIPFAVRPDKARDAYMGLCRTCLKLPTCTFLKPGGGTWDCESHE